MDVDTVPGDRELLVRHGWEISDPIAASADALHYRDFIRRSKGEFTVAKDLNVRLSSGWFSDRSACYLAAGRPVVTQDTGFGRCLPTGQGLYAVRNLAEAIEAVRTIAANYEANAQAARTIASEYFDARTVLARIINAL
jgi:glycosyltransferase involved in cell wall biosynthesis